MRGGSARAAARGGLSCAAGAAGRTWLLLLEGLQARGGVELRSSPNLHGGAGGRRLWG